MPEQKPTTLNSALRELLINFTPDLTGIEKLKHDNEKKVSTAIVYEKIRTSLEYQEEHLLLKNAISRILRRQITFSTQLDASHIKNDLINELGWANYLNPELVTDTLSCDIQCLIEQYLLFLKYAQSGRFKKHELSKMIVDWLACEVDELITKRSENDLFVDYTANILEQGIEKKNVRLSDEENKLQLRIAIYSLIFRPDYSAIQYWTFKNVYPDWNKLSKDEIKKLARSFDPFYNKIDRALNHPYKRQYLQYVKRNIPPFILLYNVLLDKKLALETIECNPSVLQNAVIEKYDKMVADGKQKVARGTYRSLTFILLTKVSLAFILEMPFDRFFFGSIDYFSLSINVLLPPTLMLVSGMFVKTPPKKNKALIANSISTIISLNSLDEQKKFNPTKKQSNASYPIFNLIYIIFSLSILYGVIMLLLYLRYNVLSIALFFFFVSAVSFFAFRIRNIALELAMKRSRDDALTSTVELVFLPFIRIGKFFSDKITAFNPFIMALDFLIEAPLKTIIKIINSWFRFINSKKEELEY